MTTMSTTPQHHIPEHSDKPILLFANVPLSSAGQRSQQMALCLSQYRPVVYVDPNRSLFQWLRRSDSWKFTLPNLPESLTLFQPPAGLPWGRNSRWINQFNFSRTLKALKKFLATQNLTNPEYIVLTNPDQIEVLEAFPEATFIYDLMDEPSLFLKPHQQVMFKQYHEQMLEGTDLLVTSSRVLLERYASPRTPAQCITNGLGQELLDELENATPHLALAKLPQPVLGYIGMISHWFDFEVIEQLANAFPTGTIALVGSNDVSLPQLPSNVIFTGVLPHHELANVLVCLDVGLVPFRCCSAIDAVNPIKVYEYLAAGLPILSSHFKEIEAFGDLVSTYDNPVHAVLQAKSLVETPLTKVEQQQRAEVARQHCWSSKAKQFLHAAQQLQRPAKLSA